MNNLRVSWWALLLVLTSAALTEHADYALPS